MKNNTEIQTANNHDDDLVSLRNAARFLNMSASFLKTLKNKNAIPFYRLGSVYKFKIGDLKAYLESCKVSTQEGQVDDV